MKLLFLLIFMSFSIADEKIYSFYDIEAISIDGDTISMNEYKNKNIMIVNVASKCGFTSQYSALQELYTLYDSTLIILGFPSNNFFWQEPGDNNEIKLFCHRNYGVTFPMFQKIHVKGKKIHPIYDWLSSKEKNGWNDIGPKWNFYKYFLNDKGELINYFPSDISPMDSLIIKLINNNN